MSFPTTGILDNFNRADQGPPPSASWTYPMYPGDGGPKVVSNQCAANVAGANDAYWNVAQFGPDSEAFCAVPVLPTIVYLNIRANVASTNWYQLRVTPASQWQIYRFDSGTPTQLGADMTQTLSAGDSVGVSVVGSVITAYYKASAGSWVSVGTRNDSTYSGAGYIGGGLNDTTGRVDDFGGGTVAAVTDLPVQITDGTLQQWTDSDTLSGGTGTDVVKRFDAATATDAWANLADTTPTIGLKTVKRFDGVTATDAWANLADASTGTGKLPVVRFAPAADPWANLADTNGLAFLKIVIKTFAATDAWNNLSDSMQFAWAMNFLDAWGNLTDADPTINLATVLQFAATDAWATLADPTLVAPAGIPRVFTDDLNALLDTFAVQLIGLLKFQSTDDLNALLDSVAGFRTMAAQLTDDANALADALNVLRQLLVQSTDDFSVLSDALSLFTGLLVRFTDDANNLLDALAVAAGGASLTVQLTEDASTLADSLLSDTYRFYGDTLQVILGYLVRSTEDTNTLADAVATFLSGRADLTVSLTDALAPYGDSLAGLLAYLAQFTDTLNFWTDFLGTLGPIAVSLQDTLEYTDAMTAMEGYLARLDPDDAAGLRDAVAAILQELFFPVPPAPAPPFVPTPGTCKEKRVIPSRREELLEPGVARSFRERMESWLVLAYPVPTPTPRPSPTSPPVPGPGTPPPVDIPPLPVSFTVQLHETAPVYADALAANEALSAGFLEALPGYTDTAKSGPLAIVFTGTDSAANFSDNVRASGTAIATGLVFFGADSSYFTQDRVSDIEGIIVPSLADAVPAYADSVALESDLSAALSDNTSDLDDAYTVTEIFGLTFDDDDDLSFLDDNMVATMGQPPLNLQASLLDSMFTAVPVGKGKSKKVNLVGWADSLSTGRGWSVSLTDDIPDYGDTVVLESDIYATTQDDATALADTLSTLETQGLYFPGADTSQYLLDNALVFRGSGGPTGLTFTATDSLPVPTDSVGVNEGLLLQLSDANVPYTDAVARQKYPDLFFIGAESAFNAADSIQAAFSLAVTGSDDVSTLSDLLRGFQRRYAAVGTDDANNWLDALGAAFPLTFVGIESLLPDIRVFHLAWDPNPPGDMVEGYRIYAGRASGVYDAPGSPVDVGNVTHADFTGQGFGWWFFAITAYNAFGESGFSNEVSTDFEQDSARGVLRERAGFLDAMPALSDQLTANFSGTDSALNLADSLRVQVGVVTRQGTVEGAISQGTQDFPNNPGTVQYVFRLLDINGIPVSSIAYATIPAVVDFGPVPPGTYTIDGRQFDQFGTQLGSAIFSNQVSF